MSLNEDLLNQLVDTLMTEICATEQALKESAKGSFSIPTDDSHMLSNSTLEQIRSLVESDVRTWIFKRLP